MKRWKRAGRKIELIVGDREDFEEPALRLHGYARDEASAERLLVLAAGDCHSDPIRWLWLPRGE